MDSIRKILRAKLLNENYFEKKNSALEEVAEAVKDLLINLRYSIKYKYKLAFFTNKLVDSLLEFKYEKASPSKINRVIANLSKEYDTKLLKELGILKALKDVADNKEAEHVINKYLYDVKGKVKNLVEKYRETIKDNKKYEVINAINDDTDKITYNKFLKEKYFLQIELLKLQEWAVSNKKKILILFEGRDAAGKGSNIEAMTEFLNPKYFRVETFGIPTEEENNNWFKRYERVLPDEGEIVFFDRSWYNRGVIEPAMGYCTQKQYKDFMDTVCEFERKIIKNKDIALVKVWLDIDKTKQKVRFELRKRDPLRYWKFTENDGSMIEKWDKLTPYIDRVLKDTHHEDIPWHIIDSDDKLNGILDSAKIILDNFDYDHKDFNILDKQKSIIFLDIHGVIITDIHKDKEGEAICGEGWDKQAIANLNEITDKSKAGLVVISSCKDRVKFKEFKKMLREAGVTGTIVGKTIDINKELRAEQIEAWFEEHGEPKNWIILDDHPYDDYEHYPKEFVKTQITKGLTQKEVSIALEKLTA